MFIGFFLQEPKKVTLNTYKKVKGYGTKRRLVEKKHEMVYVPVLRSLEALMSCEYISAEVSIRLKYYTIANKLLLYVCMQVQRGHASCDDILRDYCDGKVYKSHRLFNAHFGALQILFYYDEVEVCLSMCIYICDWICKKGSCLNFHF